MRSCVVENLTKGLTASSNPGLPPEETPWAHPSRIHGSGACRGVRLQRAQCQIGSALFGSLAKDGFCGCAAGFLPLIYGVFATYCGMEALYTLQESALAEDVGFSDRFPSSRSAYYPLEDLIYMGFFW